MPEAGRWPVQLAAALRERGLALADPRIIATTGWTTDELSAAMDAAEPLGRWDVVSLLIGVNNQYRGRDVANYADEFAALLERAIALAGDRPGRVLVLSIPDWGVHALRPGQRPRHGADRPRAGRLQRRRPRGLRGPRRGLRGHHPGQPRPRRPAWPTTACTRPRPSTRPGPRLALPVAAAADCEIDDR